MSSARVSHIRLRAMRMAARDHRTYLRQIQLERPVRGWLARLAATVPVRRTRHGAVPLLPRNSELVGGGAVSGSKRATVLVRRWADDVRVDLADAGLRLLVTTMYRGQRERIVPPAVAAVAFGERPNTRAT